MIQLLKPILGAQRHIRASRRYSTEQTQPLYHNPDYHTPTLFTEDIISKIESRLRSMPRVVLNKPSQAFSRTTSPDEPVRRAAVLVPLINWSPESASTPTTHGSERASILYSLRSSDLRSHGGQVAFPGGVMDPEDEGDPIRTALRETAEEIGISDSHLIRPLGLFHDVTSLNGILVTPVIAYIPNWKVVRNQNIKLNQDEVSEIFEVPLSTLTDRHNYSIDQLNRGRLPRYICDHMRREKDIWGMTAYVSDWLLRTTLANL